jgi:hypothetical protein
MKGKKPFGQATEITSPFLAIIGAMIITGFAVFAFSFWPNSDSLRTDATANLPKDQQGSSMAPGSPPQPNSQ